MTGRPSSSSKGTSQSHEGSWPSATRALIATTAGVGGACRMPSDDCHPAGFFAIRSRTSWAPLVTCRYLPATSVVWDMAAAASPGSTPARQAPASASAALARLNAPRDREVEGDRHVAPRCLERHHLVVEGHVGLGSAEVAPGAVPPAGTVADRRRALGADGRVGGPLCAGPDPGHRRRGPARPRPPAGRRRSPRRRPRRRPRRGARTWRASGSRRCAPRRSGRVGRD